MKMIDFCARNEESSDVHFVGEAANFRRSQETLREYKCIYNSAKECLKNDDFEALEQIITKTFSDNLRTRNELVTKVLMIHMCILLGKNQKKEARNLFLGELKPLLSNNESLETLNDIQNEFIPIFDEKELQPAARLSCNYIDKEKEELLEQFDKTLRKKLALETQPFKLFKEESDDSSSFRFSKNDNHDFLHSDISTIDSHYYKQPLSFRKNKQINLADFEEEIQNIHRMNHNPDFLNALTTQTTTQAASNYSEHNPPLTDEDLKNDAFYNQNKSLFERMNTHHAATNIMFNQRHIQGGEKKHVHFSQQVDDKRVGLNSSDSYYNNKVQEAQNHNRSKKTVTITDKLESKDFSYLKIVYPKSSLKNKTSDSKEAGSTLNQEPIATPASKRKDHSNPLKKYFNPKNVKKENIDKKVIRKFKHFLSTNSKRLGFYEKDPQFWTIFINENLLPPLKYHNPFSNENIEFKSFNTGFLTWLFTKQGAIEAYKVFIRESINEIMHDLASSYIAIDQSSELFMQIQTYVMNLATTFGIPDVNEEVVLNNQKLAAAQAFDNDLIAKTGSNTSIEAPVAKALSPEFYRQESDSFLLKGDKNENTEFNNLWENEFNEHFGGGGGRDSVRADLDGRYSLENHEKFVGRERSRNQEKNRNSFQNNNLDAEEIEEDNNMILDRIFSYRTFDNSKE